MPAIPPGAVLITGTSSANELFSGLRQTASLLLVVPAAHRPRPIFVQTLRHGRNRIISDLRLMRRTT